MKNNLNNLVPKTIKIYEADGGLLIQKRWLRFDNPYNISFFILFIAVIYLFPTFVFKPSGVNSLHYVLFILCFLFISTISLMILLNKTIIHISKGSITLFCRPIPLSRTTYKTSELKNIEKICSRRYFRSLKSWEIVYLYKILATMVDETKKTFGWWSFFSEQEASIIEERVNEYLNR